MIFCRGYSTYLVGLHDRLRPDALSKEMSIVVSETKISALRDDKDRVGLTLRRLMSYIYIWSTHS